MKIYLVKRKKTNVRWFDNEQDLNDFLINAPERLNSYQVTILNCEVESEWTADKLFDAIKEQSELDRKLTVALGDEYAVKVQKFLEAFEKWAPKLPWDKTKLTFDGRKVYEKLATVPAEEKQFMKAFSKYYDYLVYTIGSKWADSSEWFLALFEIYPKLATEQLAETCRVEYVDPVTGGTSYDGGRTSKYALKSFEKAKKLLEKEKKKLETLNKVTEK